MHKPLVTLLILACASLSLVTAVAKDKEPAAAAKPSKDDSKDTDKGAKEEDIKLPPFPADKSVPQSVTLDGRVLKYEVTVGSLPVLDEKGKTIASIMFTAYTVAGANRPVTFALNGGPGAASVYLNLGAIGPKRVQFGAEGDSPSDPAVARDNPGTWLAFTDLVFIDPVGTGFSYAQVPESEAKKHFYNPKADVEYLSRVIFDWLVKNERLTSRKYLVGESYGGFRGPRITHFLQTQLGVAMNGVVLVSPYLDPGASLNGDLSPLPWMLTLPSIAAANLERQGKLTDAAMATDRHLHAHRLRRRPSAWPLGQPGHRAHREPRHRAVRPRPDLRAPFRRAPGDPGVSARGLSCRGQTRQPLRFERHELGSLPLRAHTTHERSDSRQHHRAHHDCHGGLHHPHRRLEVQRALQRAELRSEQVVVKRRGRRSAAKAISSVARFRSCARRWQSIRSCNVLIVHGWDDLSCPFMASVLIVDQMPLMGSAQRVQVKEYPGGHMFYSRTSSQAAMRGDVMKMYAAH